MVAQRIQFFRNAKGVTRAEMGKALGVTRTAVYNWEHSIRTPTYERLVKIAEYLGVARNVFFSEKLDHLEGKTSVEAG